MSKFTSHHKEAFQEKLCKFFEKLKEKISYEESVKMCKLPVQELLESMKESNFDRINLLRAYQYMSITAHGRTNCLVGFDFEAENKLNQKIENRGSDHKDKVLQDLPISIKDFHFMKCLIDQGAILYCRTNVPQTLSMSLNRFNTDNPIFGLTINPYSPEGKNFTAGGSSGGEAALISFGGSLPGLGSDIGGSIRIPAAMCGIVGIKPTPNRISTTDLHDIMHGHNLISNVNGPLARDVSGLVLIMKALLSDTMAKCDPTLTPSYFRDHIIEWEPVEIERSINLFGRAVLADGGDMLFNLLKGDTIMENLEELYKVLTLPKIVRKILPLLTPSYDLYKQALSKGIVGIGSYRNYLKLYNEVIELRQKVIQSWEDSGIDIVIAPAFGVPSVPEKNTINHEISIWPVIYGNTLNLVGGTIPVTYVSENDVRDAQIELKENKSWCFKQMVEMCPNSINMPVGIQIYGKPNSEELVLSVMNQLETKINFQKKFFFDKDK
ncbi:putative amidase AmiB2 [Intoshia linei]|uniref:Putative amidase AmiB2 n=1 Tax=Intoshia linei TaxID=1819745 RepID=A0A177B4Z6_9BILA|nr:putative amidase AmiB2 [Intoshia linei]